MSDISYESEREAVSKLYQEVFKRPPRTGMGIAQMTNDIKCHYEYIIMNIPQSVYWKDRNSTYLGCNKMCASLAGLNDPSEIAGLTDYDFEKRWGLPKGVANSFREDDLSVIKTGKSLLNNQEEAFTSPEGKTVYQLSGKIPLKNQEGEIIGVLGISTDVTELKKTQQELLLAKEKAEQANELKTKFIQNMQHDVRTPLSAVYASMQELAQEETEPEKKRLADHLVASTGQLLLMCNEMVDFESAAYMNDDVKVEPIETKRFLSRIIDLNRVAATTRQLEIHLNIDSEVPSRLKVDKKKLYRVLVNLVGNALKFTDKGSVTLHACLLSTTKNNEVEIAFEVIDTGMGIPEDKTGLIFEKFVKLNPSNQGKYKGSGLGLYNVKKLVDSLGGKLEVETEVGKGSIFRVILTLSVPTQDEAVHYTADEEEFDSKEAISSEIQKLPDARFNKNEVHKNVRKMKTIDNANENKHQHQLLIIEDDPVLQLTIGNVFQKFDCHIAAKADSVSKACEAIKTQEYDLIICDLGIFEGTGIDVVTWAKGDKTHPNQNTPFVVLTANADEEMREKALASGFLGVFQKPLPTSLAEKILKEYVHKKTEIINNSEKINNETRPMHIELKGIINEKSIDIEATLELVGDVEMLKEIFSILKNSLAEDVKKLKDLYVQNDITETRKILHRLDGTFRSCIVPRLQLTRNELHDAVRNVDQLDTIDDKYNAFYQEVDNFLVAYNQLKAKGVL